MENLGVPGEMGREMELQDGNLKRATGEQKKQTAVSGAGGEEKMG